MSLAAVPIISMILPKHLLMLFLLARTAAPAAPVLADITGTPPVGTTGTPPITLSSTPATSSTGIPPHNMLISATPLEIQYNMSPIIAGTTGFQPGSGAWLSHYMRQPTLQDLIDLIHIPFNCHDWFEVSVMCSKVPQS